MGHEEDCRTEHQAILKRIEIAEQHEHEEIARVIDSLEGPKIEHMDGTDGPDRVKTLGMVHKVNHLYTKVDELAVNQDKIRAHLSNGIKMRLALSDKIIVAIIGAIAIVLSAVLGGG